MSDGSESSKSEKSASSQSFVEDPNSVTNSTTRDLARLLVPSPYACGGRVTIQGDDSCVIEGSVQPVTIRWDTAGATTKLSLPKISGVTKEETADIANLVSATQPASFGFQGKDVIDESYRKATKLDPSAFTTNFCPYVAGIVDILGQTLLPKPGCISQGIRAELYKMNVSGSSSPIIVMTKFRRRSTRHLLVYSSHMLILRGPTFSLDRLSYVFRASMKADSLLCGIKANQ
jgi:hypothetical protein